MDRNVLIATVLIAIIMLVWLTWLAPEPPTPAPVGQEAARDSQQTVVPAPQPEEAARAATVPAVPADSAFAAVQQGTERVITVDTDLYQARFSTHGATPVAFMLKEYRQFDQKTPVQLIDSTSKGVLSLAFTTPSSHLVDTRSFFFTAETPSDTLKVAGAPRELSFVARIGNGWIRQTYTFKPGEYEVGLRVEKGNAASFITPEGYEVVWNGGLPFNEGNREDEARHAGVYARSAGSVEYIDLNKKESDVQPLSGKVDWVAVKNKYFTAVLMPGRETRGAEIEGERTGSVEGKDQGEQFTARLLMAPSAAAVDSFRLYIGPLEFYRITDYDLGLYDMVDYGYDFFEVITRPLATYVFIPVFTLLAKLLGNYGLVIIVFSLLMKLALYPLTQSSFKSMARMRELQPKLEAIKEKYADNPQKQQEAMMKVYRETGVNPLGGCLPMLLQWPVLIALYQFLPQSIELRQAGFLWAHDLSAPDAIVHLPFSIPFYGDFVAGFTLLMGLSMVVQMRVQMQPSSNPQAKMMTYLMPVMLFMMFNRFASGLSLYYLVFNIASAIQQQFVNKKYGTGAAEPATAAVKGKPVREPKAARRQRT